MATISSDSYSITPSYVKYSKYLYNNKKSKAINRKPIFAPILEEPSNIVQNLQDLNTSSIPITNNNNNNSSFENSINGTYMVDYHTMNKFRPSLNLSCLPPVFEIPRKKLADNNNLNNNMLLQNNKSLYNDKNRNNNNENKLMMRNSRLNLRPIVNNNLNSNSNANNLNIFNNTAGGINNNNLNNTNNKSNLVSLPPINSHTNYNNIYNNNNNLNKINNNHINYSSNKINNNKNSNNSTYNIRNYNQRKKQYLKPIQFKNSPNPSSYNPFAINNNENKRTIDNDKQSGSYGKNQGKYYYNLNNRNMIRNEKLKEERALRHKEMSNISINQNKNYIDKNIVMNYNNTKGNNTSMNINMNSSTSLNINEYIEINRDKNRVMHIPTLKIYDRFDVPMKNWNLYENYVKNWSKMMRGILEINAVIENNEQNCYSIIIERSKNCSLGNLLRSIGSVNEYIILTLVKQIIPLIQKYNGIFDYRNNDIDEQIFNFVDIDNIWFNENYNVVLYPGKFKYYNKNEKLENFMKKLFGEKKDIQINIDIMNFGITLININIFLLDISVEDLFHLIKKGEEDINDACCLFHYFYKKINIFSNFYDSLKSNNANSDLYQNYFDFLHILTSFKKNEEENINIFESLLNHTFIVNSSIVNENNNINELIKVSKKYDFSNEYYTSNANILSFDLITRNISKKIINFENFFPQHNIYDMKTLFNLYGIEIEELCRELRVNEEELHDKLLVLYEKLLENKENKYY